MCDSGDIRNLPTTEVVTGTGAQQITSLPARTDQGEAMSRQGSVAVLHRGDLPADQSSLIRNIIREKLRRGLGRRIRRSERGNSVSSSSSQEGSRLSCSSHSLSNRHSRSPPSSHHSRSPSRRSFHSHAPSCSSRTSGISSRAPHGTKVMGGVSWLG